MTDTLTMRPPGQQKDATSAFIGKAAARAGAELGLTDGEVAAILGLTEHEVRRVRHGEAVFTAVSESHARALLLVRLYRSLSGVVGGDVGTLRAWMRNPNLALDGVPAARIMDLPGLHATVRYADAARARI